MPNAGYAEGCRDLAPVERVPMLEGLEQDQEAEDLGRVQLWVEGQGPDGTLLAQAQQLTGLEARSSERLALVMDLTAAERQLQGHGHPGLFRVGQGAYQGLQVDLDMRAARGV